jgi:hypothetical protein
MGQFGLGTVLYVQVDECPPDRNDATIPEDVFPLQPQHFANAKHAGHNSQGKLIFRPLEFTEDVEYIGLLLWKLDRFSREGVRKTLRYLELLDSYGVAWRSFMEPFFDSCGIMCDVVITIMATLAEQERISVSERTKAGLQHARKRGRVLGRRPVVVDVTKARKLQAEGLGLRRIAKKLNISVNTLQAALRRAA